MKPAAIKKRAGNNQERSDRRRFENTYRVFNKRKFTAQPVQIIVSERNHSDRYNHYQKRAVGSERRRPDRGCTASPLDKRLSFPDIERDCKSREGQGHNPQKDHDRAMHRAERVVQGRADDPLGRNLRTKS